MATVVQCGTGRSALTYILLSSALLMTGLIYLKSDGHRRLFPLPCALSSQTSNEFAALSLDRRSDLNSRYPPGIVHINRPDEMKFTMDSAECPSDLVFQPHENDYFSNLSARLPDWGTKFVRKGVYSEHVVILVPVSNSERYLWRLFKNICSLTYPHSLISIVLGEDSSRDKTYDSALEYLGKMQRYFARVELISLKGQMSFHGEKHELGVQKVRRSHLATSRNKLLFTGLRDETWVLWMDSDVKYIPTDLIERLLSAEKDIVTPACMFVRSNDKVDVYDRNTWKETPESRDFLRKQPEDFLMLEGYAPTSRKYLSDLRDDHQVVEIDGVGGCVLLIRADVHRNGVVFPSFVFQHHIETEGLAKLAREMGYTSYGMPFVEVFHT